MIRLDINLTTEQEFELRALEYRLANMDEHEAKQLLLQATRLLLLRETLIKSLIRELVQGNKRLDKAELGSRE